MQQRKGKRSKTRLTYRFKHVFTVFLLSYLLMLIVPSASSIYLYSNVLRITERNCVQGTLTALNEAGAELNFLLSSMDNSAYRMVYDSDLVNIMYMPRPSDGNTKVNEFVRFTKRLDEKLGGVTDVLGGYRMLFRENELVFYSSAMSQGLEFYFDNALTYQSMNYAQWYEAVFTPQSRVLLPYDTVDFGQYTAQALTYSFPIIRKTPTGGHRMAVLQFFITEDTFMDSLPMVADSGSAFLVDMQGNVLANFGDQQPYPLQDIVVDDPSGSIYQGDNLIIYAKVNQDYMLVAALPTTVTLADANSLRAPIFGILIACAILEGFLCYFFARRNAQPIERFASNVKPLLSDQTHQYEYAYFDESVAQLRQSQQTATMAMEQKRKIETSLLLDWLFDEERQDSRDLFELANNIDIELRAQGYCVVTIESEESVPWMRGDDAVPELPPGLRCLSHTYQKKFFSLLYFCDTPETASYDAIIQHLEVLKDSMPENVRIGVGRIYPSIEDVTFSYQQSFYCVQQKSAEAGIAIFDQVSRNSNAPHFTLEQQQRLLNAVKHNNEAVIDEEIDRVILENTENRHLPAALKRILMANVESILLMAAEEIVQEDNLSDYLRSVQQSTDFREQLETLRGELKKVSRAGESRYNVRNVILRKEMQDYVSAVYSDPSLSVASAAAHFDLSESYFSMLFKDSMGEAYSNYVEKMRLAQAKQLMRTTNMSVEDIAQAVGYNHSTTFRRAFKRVVGLSPVQYKQQAEHEAGN